MSSLSEKAYILFWKGLSFISNRKRRKEGTFCEFAPEEKGIHAFVNKARRGAINKVTKLFISTWIFNRYASVQIFSALVQIDMH
jgi:hypothetical protein